MLRYTLGASIVLAQGVRLKLTPELWQFDYADPAGGKLEASMDIAVDAAFQAPGKILGIGLPARLSPKQARENKRSLPLLPVMRSRHN